MAQSLGAGARFERHGYRAGCGSDGQVYPMGAAFGHGDGSNEENRGNQLRAQNSQHGENSFNDKNANL
jgi:hypothetical protein